MIGRCVWRRCVGGYAGANVGYISAVAASCVGKSGAVHGFEPLPECFARLQTLRGLNPDSPFFFNHVALGERPGILPHRLSLRLIR
jgi:FkbM family methyltransferase